MMPEAKVTGIDFSHRSIGYALNKAEVSGRNISYIEGNYLDAELPGVGSYDLATMIYCDFCPLSPAQRKNSPSPDRQDSEAGREFSL